MQPDVCLFEGQEYQLEYSLPCFSLIWDILWGARIYDEDLCEGTDAFRAVGVTLVVERGVLLLRDLRVHMLPDRYRPIGGVHPVLSGGLGECGVYPALNIQLPYSGRLLLLQEHVRSSLDLLVHWAGGICGSYSSDEFATVLELQFVEGMLTGRADRSAESEERWMNDAHDALMARGREYWQGLAEWMATSRTESWTGEQLELVSSAAKGIIPRDRILDLLGVRLDADFTRSEEKRVLADEAEAREFAAIGRDYWQRLHDWLVATDEDPYVCSQLLLAARGELPAEDISELLFLRLEHGEPWNHSGQ